MRKVLLTCLILTLLVFSFGAHPVVATLSTDETPVSDRIQSTQEPSPATIDPTLHNESGQTTVVVQFTDHADYLSGSDLNSVATLQSHASQTQREFVTHAVSHPNISILERFWVSNAILIEVDSANTSLTTLGSIRHVDRIHPDFAVHTANQTLSHAQMRSATTAPQQSSNTTYGLTQISASTAWNQYNTRGDGATVAVLDTGIDVTNHSDLSVRDNRWHDFVNNRSDPYDDNGHGTHVSGIVAGNQTTAGVHYGVAPEATLLHGKVLDDSGSGQFSDVLKAIEWSVSHESGVDVLSLSLGTDDYYAELIEPVRNARSAGVVVIAAVGNTGRHTSSSPGNVYETLSVGATTPDRTVGEFSGGERVNTSGAWGSMAPNSWPESYYTPDLTAPGVSIVSAAPGGDYRRATGTSMATPHVAGAAALVQAATDSRLSPAEIETHLTQTAQTPSDSVDCACQLELRYGAGIVNVHTAIASARGGDPTPEFALSNVSLAESKILENDSVSVYTTVTNTGDAPGRFTATLRANGDQLANRSRYLSPGETAAIQFSPTFSSRGSYRLTVNDGSAGVLRVDRPANLKLYSADIRNQTLSVNQTTTISATVVNLGDRNGTYTGEFRSNGRHIHTETALIQPDDTVSFAVPYSFASAGEYTLSINDHTIGTVTVTGPTTFNITNYSITPNPVPEQTNTTVSVTVANTRDTSQQFSGDLRADGHHLQSKAVVIPGRGSRTLSYSHSFEQNGTYNLSVRRTAIGDVHVTNPPAFEVGPVTPASATLSTTDSHTVSVTVRNVGGSPGTIHGAFTRNNTTVDTASRFLLPDRQRTLSTTFTFNETGTYQLGFADTEPARVTVIERNASIEQYRSSDGTVKTAGLREAVDDWRRDHLTTPLLREVIAAWRSG